LSCSARIVYSTLSTIEKCGSNRRGEIEGEGKEKEEKCGCMRKKARWKRRRERGERGKEIG
jgi:hypothetical protein